MIEYKQDKKIIMFVKNIKNIIYILKVLVLTREINAQLTDSEIVDKWNITVHQDLFPQGFGYSKDLQRFDRDFPKKNILPSLLTKDDLQSLNATLVPSEPTFPRAFVDFNYNLKQKNISVTFRWKESEFTNGMIQKYTVQYWFDEKVETTIRIDNIPAMILQHKVYNLKSDTMYHFQVQAHNKDGAGPYTNFINVSTTHENSVPLLLVTSWNDVKVLDMDLQISYAIFKEYRIKSIEIVYSELEHKIYWINNKWELMTCDFNPNAIKIKCNDSKITDLDASAHDLRIDWVARNLYWIQFSEYANNIMKLDLELLQIGIIKYDSILKRNGFKFINVLPSIGYFYWMELNSDNQHMIMQSDFDGKNVQPFLKNENNTCSCSYKLLELISSIQIDNTNIDNPLLYWTSKDRLIAADIYGCRCSLILSAGNNQILFNKLTIDKTNIYLYSSYERLIYILKKKYALLESKENAFKHVQKVSISDVSINIHQIIALSTSLQPYPLRCLLPSLINTKSHENGYFEERTITGNSVVVNLPELVPINGCKKYDLATTIYTISMKYRICLDNNIEKDEDFNVQTYERHYKIQNLTPFTTYTLKEIKVRNFYIGKSILAIYMDKSLRTTAGKLNAPENVTVQVLTPTLAAIYWMPPKKLNCVDVKYEVYWLPVYFSNGTQKITDSPQYLLIDNPKRTVDGKFFMTTNSNLSPGQEYVVYVRVYPNGYNYLFTDSLNTSVNMYSEPNKLILKGVDTNSMNISWNYSFNITNYYLKYKKDDMLKDIWDIANNTKIYNNTVTYYITNLLPRTRYKFYLVLRYSNYKEEFTWPFDARFTFKTRGNVPSAPGMPTITKIQDSAYRLNWKPPVKINSNTETDDPQVTIYQLEGSIVENDYKKNDQINKNEHWNLCYNGTENYWIITQDMKLKYQFRVRAENAYGFGEWSKSSAIVDLSLIEDTQNYLSLILIMTGFVITMIYVSYLYYSYQQPKRINKYVLSSIMSEMELASLYKISSENIEFNPYASKLQYNEEEFVLTRIRETQITLTKLLGSGTFGKVHQGTVKNFEGSSTIPVAIKIPHTNSSLKQKTEFLQEAKLMSHLRHKHVLRLLGICINADSPWLILELMEGGDLLKYLRENRTLHLSDSQALRLQDLLAMCEDVARGGSYLERMHFVHRDLACRNCLISAKNRENRIVKIGDFGLTKDIYKDDYYRSTKDNPLPVRWMAPESLMHKIFTSQSDVWAFGVLMWEITSLGEQPYSARSNFEVFEYVCRGDKLRKPLNCPPTLYQLMQLCWNAAKNRPNFTDCLNNIIKLRDNTEDAILSSVNIMRRAKLAPSGQIEDSLEVQPTVPPNI